MFNLGFCYWELPAVLLLVAILSIYIFRRNRLKQSCARYEQKLKEIEARKDEHPPKPRNWGDIEDS